MNNIEIIINLLLFILNVLTLFYNLKKESRERNIKIENLKLNIIKIMEYNASSFHNKKCIKKGEEIIIKDFEERIAELGEKYCFSNEIYSLYSYFLSLKTGNLMASDYIDKRLLKYLKYISREECYYFLKKEYIDILLKIKNEKNKYIHWEENNQIHLKINKNSLKIDVKINENGNETGQTILEDENIFFYGKVENDVKKNGILKTKDYEFNGELKNDLPYNGKVKYINSSIKISSFMNDNIFLFCGELRNGLAYSGTGQINNIEGGKINSSERLAMKYFELFASEQEKEEFYFGNTIPEEVQKEIYLEDRLKSLKKTSDFILVTLEVKIMNGNICEKILLIMEEYMKKIFLIMNR